MFVSIEEPPDEARDLAVTQDDAPGDAERCEDDFFHGIGKTREDPLGGPGREGSEGPLLVAHHVIEREMRSEKKRGHGRPEPDREGDDPQQRDGFLQRGPPVVMRLVPLPVFFQVERKLDRMVDEVDAVAEGVGEGDVFTPQSEELDSQRRHGEMRQNSHGAIGSLERSIISLVQGP